MAAQHSVRRADHIEYGFWLIFHDDGGVRMSRGQPNCSRDERGMKLTARLPLSLFSTPSLRAEINITDRVSDVPPIDLSAAGEALRSALGVDVVLTLHEPGER